MKKRILIALLAVVLIILGLVGAAYAVDGHQPAKGNKLVGVGVLGTIEFSKPGQPPTLEKVNNTSFNFTNPDCSGEITITKVSVIEDPRYPNIEPKLVYEGPFIYKSGPGITRTVMTRAMMPHEMWSMSLGHYMYTGDGTNPDDLTAVDNWKTLGDAIEQPAGQYIVEIEWEAKGNIAPLMGWSAHTLKDIYLIGDYEGMYINQDSLPMVNSVQRGK